MAGVIFDRLLASFIRFASFFRFCEKNKQINKKKKKMAKENNDQSEMLDFLLNVFNPLSANPTKWSNTLKKFFGKSRMAL